MIPQKCGIYSGYLALIWTVACSRTQKRTEEWIMHTCVLKLIHERLHIWKQHSMPQRLTFLFWIFTRQLNLVFSFLLKAATKNFHLLLILADKAVRAPPPPDVQVFCLLGVYTWFSEHSSSSTQDAQQHSYISICVHVRLTTVIRGCVRLLSSASSPRCERWLTTIISINWRPVHDKWNISLYCVLNSNICARKCIKKSWLINSPSLQEVKFLNALVCKYSHNSKWKVWVLDTLASGQRCEDVQRRTHFLFWEILFPLN